MSLNCGGSLQYNGSTDWHVGKQACMVIRHREVCTCSACTVAVVYSMVESRGATLNVYEYY